jgi:hypothetical protein
VTKHQYIDVKELDTDIFTDIKNLHTKLNKYQSDKLNKYVEELQHLYFGFEEFFNVLEKATKVLERRVHSGQPGCMLYDNQNIYEYEDAVKTTLLYKVLSKYYTEQLNKLLQENPNL